MHEYGRLQGNAPGKAKIRLWKRCIKTVRETYKHLIVYLGVGARLSQGACEIILKKSSKEMH